MKEDKKPKSEAMLRYEKAEAGRVKKHLKKVDKQREALEKQFGSWWYR